MMRKLLGILWGRVPGFARRWGVRLSQSTFTVTSAAVVIDDQERVLLLRHVFRGGSGWGIPGGFLTSGEQPEQAIRRELREEIGLEVERLEMALVRTVKNVDQVEIIFRCSPDGQAQPRSIEIKSAEWFALDALPDGLGSDQRGLIERVVKGR